MVDKEIIKALEMCLNFRTECDGCPYETTRHCHTELKRDALDLINRQQAEIEELKEFSTARFDKFATEYDWNIRAEAIKGFADKLKGSKFPYTMHGGITVFYYTEEDIDNLVKEMGADNG